MELPWKMQWFHKLIPWWPLGSLPIPVCSLPVTTFPLKNPGSMLSLSLSPSHPCVEPPGMCSSFASSWKPALITCRYIDCRQGWVHLFDVPQYVVAFLVVIVCLWVCLHPLPHHPWKKATLEQLAVQWALWSQDLEVILFHFPVPYTVIGT